MTTRATTAIKQFAADWKGTLGYKSARISGIVPDRAHLKRGGYHVSRDDQVSTSNYSVVRPDDKKGPSDAAAAVDMTMNTADMIQCTKRLVAAYSNTADPRRKYINAFNGTTDGKTARRWDFYARTVKAATSDHLWHVHLEFRRAYVDSQTAMAAVLSILRGESVATYLKAIGVVTTPIASVKPPAFPGRILKRSDSQKTADAAVRAFQARMIERGWTSLGTADGFFGPKLEDVVKRWQETCGLTPDGEIGEKTWPTPWTRPLGK